MTQRPHAPTTAPAPADTADTLDFPGFLRTQRGLYISHADFLAFVGRAAATSAIAEADTAQAWLARHGLPADLSRLSPSQVSRVLFLAQRTFAPHLASGNGRGRQGAPARR
jgi:hypothetical protein